MFQGLKVVACKRNPTTVPGLCRRAFAGHSKWSNIKHKKGAKDAQKAKRNVKISTEITVSLKNSAGDMENIRFQAAITRAKQENVPKDTIDKAIQKGLNTQTTVGESVRYEGYGPGSVAMIVEGITDNKHRTGPAIRHLFSKYGGNMQTEGAVSWLFDRVGCLQVPMASQDGTELDRDQLFDAAIEAGATDVEFPEDPDSTETTDEDDEDDEQQDSTCYVYCDSSDLGSVREQLLAKGVQPSICELVWRPKDPESNVELEGKKSDTFGTLLEALDDNEDVHQRIP